MNAQCKVPKVLRWKMGVIVALAAAASGVPARRVSAQEIRSPVPLLNADGSIPKEQINHVFLDPRTEDLLVLFPEEAGGRGNTRTKMITVELSTHICPRVSTKIVFRSEAGKFEYNYTLYNCIRARQSALLWFLGGVDDSRRVTVKVPSSWEYHFPYHDVARVASSPIERSLGIMASNDPNTPERATGVPPGVYRSGLQLTSRMLPGLIHVYVQGRSAVPVFPSEPPDDIANALKMALGYPFNYRESYAFGPKYGEAIDAGELAKALLRDLEALAVASEIDKTHSFHKAATRLLMAHPDTASVGQLAPLAQTSREREFAIAVAQAFAHRE